MGAILLPNPSGASWLVHFNQGTPHGRPENEIFPVLALKRDCPVRKSFDKWVVGRKVVRVVQLRFFPVTSQEYLSAGLAVEQL
jgi:hypothetical protein